MNIKTVLKNILSNAKTIEGGEKMIIAKVRLNKGSMVKLITVPKDCKLDVGDYVMLTKIVREEKDIKVVRWTDLRTTGV